MMKKLFILAILALATTPVYAQSVDTAWVRRYNGPGNGEDKASAMKVDGYGNIYVTGYSTGNGTSHDYTTIKYYPNGDTAWVRSYNGDGNGQDEATAIEVDGLGNVYVTGRSTGIAGDWDYVTIKYYPDGHSWVRRWNRSPENFSDEACAIAVDGSGNLYVTGYSISSATAADYATIKYDSSGNELWVRIYDGPGHSEDRAFAMALDGSGNIYVTGRSTNIAGNWDYATIKYSPTGDVAANWPIIYNGPGNGNDWANAIVVDNSGNVYVTGSSYGGGTAYDYATIKYYPNGDVAPGWPKRYNGPVDGWDVANAITIYDTYVYVTGTSYGDQTSYDYVTIKYDTNGNEHWVRRYYVALVGWDEAYAIAVDDSGYVYVTGKSDGIVTALDYATIKYKSNGDTAWVRRYNGPGNGGDEAYAIAVDDSHYVYVTGGSIGDGTNFDYVTIKYVQLPYLCGDVNGDGVVNSADIVYLINYLFIGGPAPNPIQAGDANQDGTVNSADVAYLINYLFIGGPAPCG